MINFNKKIYILQNHLILLIIDEKITLGISFAFNKQLNLIAVNLSCLKPSLAYFWHNEILAVGIDSLENSLPRHIGQVQSHNCECYLVKICRYVLWMSRCSDSVTYIHDILVVLVCVYSYSNLDLFLPYSTYL